MRIERASLDNEFAVHPSVPDLNTPRDADVVFALTGDVRKNSRARRQLRALAQLGLRTYVIFLDADAASGFDLAHAHFHPVEPPEGAGSRYFWSVHRKFTEAVTGVQARVYHASDLYVLPALARAARKANGKLVYDARELYPHVSSTAGRPWVRHFWRGLERRFIRRTDAVFTVSGGVAEKLVEFYGVARPTVIYNVPESREITRRVSIHDRIGERSRPIILHLGQIREHRGCERLVDAMRSVQSADLVFLGDGPLKEPLRQRAADSGIQERVHFLDPVPPDDVLDYAASADVGVTLLDDRCLNHRLALPNKLFEYLSAGLPVVASDLPEIRKVVRDYDVGQVVRPGSERDLVAALNQAILDRSLRMRWQQNIPKVLETFNWERASHDFLHVYNDLLSNP